MTLNQYKAGCAVSAAGSLKQACLAAGGLAANAVSNTYSPSGWHDLQLMALAYTSAWRVWLWLAVNGLMLDYPTSLCTLWRLLICCILMGGRLECLYIYTGVPLSPVGGNFWALCLWKEVESWFSAFLHCCAIVCINVEAHNEGWLEEHIIIYQRKLTI